MKDSNLYLVGFMGAGKTEVGCRLAELLGWPFIDLDLEIEKRQGASVAEIFRQQGEIFFRVFEQATLQRVSEHRNQVVAVGGGAFCCAENRQIIARTGTSIWLDAPLELLFERCSGDPASRPLFAGGQEMARLLERRRPFYASAQLRVQVGGLSIDDLARQILTQTTEDPII
jgi:shikimate kinase